MTAPWEPETFSHNYSPSLHVDVVSVWTSHRVHVDLVESSHRCVSVFLYEDPLITSSCSLCFSERTRCWWRRGTVTTPRTTTVGCNTPTSAPSLTRSSSSILGGSKIFLCVCGHVNVLLRGLAFMADVHRGLIQSEPLLFTLLELHMSSWR